MDEPVGPGARGDILIVDDTPANLRLLTEVLQGVGYRVRAVTRGERALAVARQALPNLILLDVRLPDLDGFVVCAQLKQDPATQAVPVIFISALDATDVKVHAFAAGAVDYVTKPLNPNEVLARVHTHLALRELHLQLQVANEALAERLGELERTNARLHAEIEARRQAEAANMRLLEELRQMACTDALTGLYNRRHFFELAGRELERARRTGSPLGLLMVDLDHFKAVNDNHGHQVGDQVLQAVAQLFAANLRSADVAARYGGEELVVLLPDTGPAQAQQAAERLREAVGRSPLGGGANPIAITVSIGVAALQGAELRESLELLLARADEALYAAKRAGRNRVMNWGRLALDTAA
ncbi:MAG: diguanylate cyclase [Chloroflexi bacterium OHK40]